tara:strand:- start:325 stop:510 length:186 start_codon:yes stop_codon:yes gene_type:complete
VKIGDVIYDHWINMTGIVIDTYLQPPSMQFPVECLMLLAMYEDNSISYVEEGDAEVLNESR